MDQYVGVEDCVKDPFVSNHESVFTVSALHHIVCWRYTLERFAER